MIQFFFWIGRKSILKNYNWLKKAMSLLLAIVLALSQSSLLFASSDNNEMGSSLKIATLSDTHYLSPTMIKDTEDYTTHLNSDRKMFTESSAILDRMIETVKKDKPDVVMITGDLTKDGELENHQELAIKLEALKKDLPDLHIYVTPGNHDIRNKNGMNFNTSDGKAIPATRTNPQDFKDCYKNVTYNDKSILTTYTPPIGKEAGGLSYVARPEPGFTIISIDSARYSKDNTDACQDEHETSGAISSDLEKWILEQIKEAKLRGDTVIGMQHHGMIEHFTMEPEILSMYLVNDYQRLRDEFTNAGMQYIFTGHMHANDIAEYTTATGNKLYDIETGSIVTYPSPIRLVTIDRKIENNQVKEDFNVRTITGIGPITYISPLDEKMYTINNVTNYGKQHGFSNDMLTTTVNGFLEEYYNLIAQNGSKKTIEYLISYLVDQIAPEYSILIKDKTLEELIPTVLGLVMPNTPQVNEKFKYWYTSTDATLHISYGEGINAISFNLTTQAIGESIKIIFDATDQKIGDSNNLKKLVAEIIEQITSMKVSQDVEQTKTLLDYVNYIYQSHLDGNDNEILQPQWVKEANVYVAEGSFINDLINIIIDQIGDIAGEVTNLISVNDLLGVKGINILTKKWQSQDNRTPLLQSTNDNTDNTIIMIWLMFLNAQPDNINEYLYTISNDYNFTQLLMKSSQILESLGVSGIKLDIKEILSTLINGNEGGEGIIDSAIRKQITHYLVSIIDSLGNDTNYPQDNDTRITYLWSLKTDRTALDQAINQAENLDLSLYTPESAQAVIDALDLAKKLSLFATQVEMDQVTKGLTNAISELILLSNNDLVQPSTSTLQTPKIPSTGDNITMLLSFSILLFSLIGYIKLKRD